MYNNTLNDKQNLALLEINKPLLILAGAGSGKTRVITHKIAFLIKEKAFSPNNIFAVTFTNKAAKEMKERVHKLLNINNNDEDLYKPLWISTFHSACARILRQDIHKINYNRYFTIYDSQDTKKLINNITKKYSPSTGKNVNAIVSYISKCKNKLEKPDDIINKGKNKQNEFIRISGNIYKKYEEELKNNNALDFDDLITKTILLFEKNPKTLEYYKQLFKYIMIDEFQDTNYVQYHLIKLLSKENNISVVGDDDQSIYSWRGADISNILNFQQDFKNCSTIKLEQNYRSTQNILNASYSLVKNNKDRMDKKLWTNKDNGRKLSFWKLHGDRDEAKKVIDKIKELINNDTLNKNIAIFYRMNYQSRTLEEYLVKSKIPYRLFGGVKFYERMEIKDIISYLIALVNENDSLALKRIINIPKRKIGKTSISKIETIQEELSLSFYNAYLYCVENMLLKGQAKQKIQSFLNWIENKRKSKNNKSITEILEELLDDIKYEEHLEKNFDNFEERIENIDEFKRAILEYEKEEENPSLEHFIMEMALRTDTDNLNENENSISLMTVHNAKGLEFDYVFIIGMCEGIFPHYRALDDRKEMEEERRLLYVGITRAKKQCLLFSSAKQFNFGSIQYYEISRFISEIDSEYIDEYEDIDSEYIDEETEETEERKKINQIKRKFHNKKKEDKKEHITNIKDISLGETLLHNVFGKGAVVKINDKGDLSTVLIDFSGKRRLLILKYTTLYKNEH